MIPYFDLPLSIEDFDADPIAQFELWYQQIKENEELEPSAMALATVTPDYHLSNRMLLLKGVDAQGFTFFTHYTSPKGQDLDQTPQAAMVFWWPRSQRQIRIEGTITRVSEKESDHYFDSRGRDKQIAALASVQSEEIPNREYLLQKVASLEEKYSNGAKIPRPPTWGGFRLHPHTIEFWQGRMHRVHDRFLYEKVGKQWKIKQLSP